MSLSSAILATQRSPAGDPNGDLYCDHAGEHERELYRTLVDSLRAHRGVVVAFSGGVDSSLVLKAALDALGGDRVVAVTAESETYTPEELEDARAVARSLGAQHLVVSTSELADPRFAANPADRCYYCKSELFSRMRDIASERGGWRILDGFNLDDEGDHRPGHRAALESAVISPLQTVGAGKAQVREMARKAGLPNWEKPAAACLASRFAYGMTIDAEGLRRVASAEKHLRSLGLGRLRLRVHGDLARIELDAPELEQKDLLVRLAQGGSVAFLKSLGYKYVTLDLEGYRTGSMNETMNETADATGLEAAREGTRS